MQVSHKDFLYVGNIFGQGVSTYQGVNDVSSFFSIRQKPVHNTITQNNVNFKYVSLDVTGFSLNIHCGYISSALFVTFWKVFVSSKLPTAYRSYVHSSYCPLPNLGFSFFAHFSHLNLILSVRASHFLCSVPFLAVSSRLLFPCWYANVWCSETPLPTSAFLGTSTIEGIQTFSSPTNALVEFIKTSLKLRRLLQHVSVYKETIIREPVSA